MNTLPSFVDLFDKALLMPAADSVGERQRLTFLQDCLTNATDSTIRDQLGFHYETEKKLRTVDSLRDRLMTVINRTHDQKLREQQTRSIQQQMAPKSRGNAARDKEKEPAASDVEKQFREQLAAKDRTITGMAAQLKANGLEPDYKKKKGKDKGSKGDGKGPGSKRDGKKGQSQKRTS